MIEKGRNLNIIWGYILFVTLLLTTGVVVFLGSKHTKNQIHELTTNLIRTNELLYDFKKGMLSIQDQIDKHIEANTLAEKDSIQAEIARNTLDNNIRLQSIKTHLTNPNAMVLVNELDKQRMLSISLRPELFRISKSNKDSALEFNRLYQNEAFHKFLIAYDNLSDYAIKTTQNKSEYLQNFISKTRIKIFVLVVLSLASLLYLGWLVYTSKQRLIQQKKIIEKREVRFKNFIDAMPDASLAVNRSGEIIYFNKQASLLFGYRSDELLNKKIEILMPERSRANHPKQREGYYANPENRLMGGSSRDLYGRKKDGSEFACDIALNSIETDEGVIVLSTIRDITDKKKAELALINSGTQLNKAQEIAHLGGWEHNLIDNKACWSDETYRILEIDKNKLDPYLCYDAYIKLIHPDDLEMINSVYKQSVDNKTAYTKDYRLLFPDGRIKYVEEQCETIYDINNIPIKSFGSIQDITVRKITELKVQNSELQLKKAQEIAHLGSWELDIVKNSLIWSDEIYRIFEIDKNKFGASYEAFINAIHPDDREMVNTAYSESLKNKTAYRIIHRLMFSDGRIKYVEEQCETKYDINDLPLKSFGTVQDVTGRTEAEKMLQESETKYRGLFENMLDGVYKSSLEGKFFEVNPAMVNMLGYDSKEDLMSINIKKDLYFNEADREAARKQEEGGEVAVIRLRKKDGTEIWAEDRGHYVLDEKGDLLYNEGVLRDVTARVLAEQERAKAANDLIYKNKDLEQFAYIVSHNLRAPVANIIGLTDMLKNTDLPDESKVEFNKGLFLSANKLDEVVKDLNTILQVRGQVIEKKEKVVLSKIVASIEESVLSIIESNKAIIYTDFTAIDEINSIKSYIYSIFYNLILNSIKYRKARINPVIEIRTELIGDKKIIRFKDNGIGFNMSQNGENVFGLYKRFNPEIEGKGVGLYMVKMQVESLGGKITLNSELGHGSEFIIEFNRTK